MTEPDAWLYDSVTIKANGREVDSETAKVDREKHWPNERALFTVESVIGLWQDSMKNVLLGEVKELRNGADRGDVADMMEHVAEKFEAEIRGLERKTENGSGSE